MRITLANIESNARGSGARSRRKEICLLVANGVAELIRRSLDPRLTGPALLVPPESQAHSNGVNEIITYQTGGHGERKLRARGRDQPMLIARSAPRVSGVPPAVHNTCCNREDDEKREPSARSVEESFRSALPTSHR